MTDRPEILDTGTEKEILYQRLCDEVSRVAGHALNPDLTVRDDIDAIARFVITGVLRNLRVMSARQMAVLLAQEANRGVGYEIREPPRYTAEEIEDVTG